MKNTIVGTKTYTWKECCDMFGRRYGCKRQFEYIRHDLKGNFILGPATHRTSRQKKYYISGMDLYRLIRGWRPKFVPLIRYKEDE